ncbi:MAG: Ca2+-binding protein toxin [Edaphobacter sp.]|nr:Ca2+-binding protein toxin [Edaphobacter sp.]
MNAEIIWYHSQTGETQIWFMNGARVASRATVLGETGQPTFIGPPFSIVGVGNFNSDGNADILWHNSQTQETQIWFMNGARVASRATVLGETGQPTFIGPPFSIVGVNSVPLRVNTGRMCDYLDAPGTPQIGFRSYLINSHPQGLKQGGDYQAQSMGSNLQKC